METLGGFAFGGGGGGGGMPAGILQAMGMGMVKPRDSATHETHPSALASEYPVQTVLVWSLA